MISLRHQRQEENVIERSDWNDPGFAVSVHDALAKLNELIASGGQVVAIGEPPNGSNIKIRHGDACSIFCGKRDEMRPLRQVVDPIFFG